MERLYIDHGRSIFPPAINFNGPRFAQFNRDDPRRRIGTEEHRVLLKFHCRSREPEKEIRKAGKEKIEPRNEEMMKILRFVFSRASWIPGFPNKKKFVSRGRRNEHARRVRYPDHLL
jgi:hypothetical protein